MAGDRNLPTIILQGTCRWYSERTPEEFEKALTICFNWDSGGYSGLQYNVGVAYNLDADVSAVLEPKVQPQYACLNTRILDQCALLTSDLLPHC